MAFMLAKLERQEILSVFLEKSARSDNAVTSISRLFRWGKVK